MGGRLVPWIPRPKLSPKRDGVHGAPGDSHLHSGVSGVCRGPSCVLEALWRNGRVHIYIVTCVPSSCSLRELLLARVSRCDFFQRGGHLCHFHLLYIFIFLFTHRRVTDTHVSTCDSTAIPELIPCANRQPAWGAPTPTPTFSSTSPISSAGVTMQARCAP